jgi:hypothetical protein
VKYIYIHRYTVGKVCHEQREQREKKTNN